LNLNKINAKKLVPGSDCVTGIEASSIDCCILCIGKKTPYIKY